MTTKQQECPAAVARLQPITVEFGDVYCRNHTINTFRIKVRGAWSLTRLHQRPEGGRDIGAAMAAMPAIPGQRLRIEPKEMKAYIEDPLADEPELLDSINSIAQKARSIWKGAPYKPVPTTDLTLSPDHLKTLLYELLRKEQAQHITVIKGKLPDKDKIDELPGKELYDPWNNGRKPTYVEDVEGWQQRLEEREGL